MRRGVQKRTRECVRLVITSSTCKTVYHRRVWNIWRRKCSSRHTRQTKGGALDGPYSIHTKYSHTANNSPKHRHRMRQNWPCVLACSAPRIDFEINVVFHERKRIQWTSNTNIVHIINKRNSATVIMPHKSKVKQFRKVGNIQRNCFHVLDLIFG